jgi:hypothetical protein
MIARDNGRARLSSAQQESRGARIEFALQLIVFAMTAPAARFQDRPHMSFKVNVIPSLPCQQCAWMGAEQQCQ